MIYTDLCRDLPIGLFAQGAKDEATEFELYLGFEHLYNLCLDGKELSFEDKLTAVHISFDAPIDPQRGWLLPAHRDFYSTPTDIVADSDTETEDESEDDSITLCGCHASQLTRLGRCRHGRSMARMRLLYKMNMEASSTDRASMSFVLPVEKYKNKKLEQVMESDSRYVIWLSKQDWVSDEFKAAIEENIDDLKLNFGRHKGSTVKKIKENDYKYYEWLLR
ncbi:hypothetical protein PInf_011982 [Phytophthora infestans]|nr:hypothetical protein PInf_011982 [Phytophthora infestans]